MRQNNLILRALMALILIAVIAYAGYAGWLAYRNTGYNSYGVGSIIGLG